MVRRGDATWPPIHEQAISLELVGIPVGWRFVTRRLGSMPPIDESSPLHGATPETLARDEVERSVPPPRAHLADAGVPLPALNALHDEGHLRLDGDDRGCERRAAGSAVARATTSLPVLLSPVSARCSGSV